LGWIFLTNVFKYPVKGALFRNGIPFPATPFTRLCPIFVPVAAWLRMLRMFTGSVVDVAPFVPRLPEMAYKEALAAPLAWIVPTEKTRLIHLGLGALVQREVALRLAALGGTARSAS
jgi:hypothetical protein